MPRRATEKARDQGKPIQRGITGCSAYGPKCRRRHFGPFFLKFCSYFPYNAKLCLNGNHWAQQQATRAGIAFEALDNGFAAVSDPAVLQSICDRLGPAQIASSSHAPSPPASPQTAAKLSVPSPNLTTKPGTTPAHLHRNPDATLDLGWLHRLDFRTVEAIAMDRICWTPVHRDAEATAPRAGNGFRVADLGSWLHT